MEVQDFLVDVVVPVELDAPAVVVVRVLVVMRVAVVMAVRMSIAVGVVVAVGVSSMVMHIAMCMGVVGHVVVHVEIVIHGLIRVAACTMLVTRWPDCDAFPHTRDWLSLFLSLTHASLVDWGNVDLNCVVN